MEPISMEWSDSGGAEKKAKRKPWLPSGIKFMPHTDMKRLVRTLKKEKDFKTRCKLMACKMRKEVALIYLPPHTPQLNPNEIEIRMIKERLAGMYFDSADALRDAIKAIVGRGEVKPVKLMDSHVLRAPPPVDVTCR